jgi:inorganic pyrophosphatase
MTKVKAVVEMPKETRYKYEIKDGILTVDRVLSKQVPFNYGFVPNTLANDGDPLDVFVVSFEPIQAGAAVTVDVIGGFDCVDNGAKDEKLIGVLEGEMFPYAVEMIKEYLDTYKQGFIVERHFDLAEALEIVEKYQVRRDT